MKEHFANIGKSMIFTAQVIPAPVTILDIRQAFGRVDYLVRACNGFEKWVSADSCKVSSVPPVI